MFEVNMFDLVNLNTSSRSSLAHSLARTDASWLDRFLARGLIRKDMSAIQFGWSSDPIWLEFLVGVQILFGWFCLVCLVGSVGVQTLFLSGSWDIA